MPITVAIFDRTLELIHERLDALDLDIIIRPFNEDGWHAIDGIAVDPSEMEIDFFWLSANLSIGGTLAAAFELVLACKSVGLVQTFNAGLDNPYYKKIADKGIPIHNSSAQAIAISEYVMAQVLSLVQPVDLQKEQQGKKLWQRTPFRELSGMNWLIIGYGPIGQQIAKRVKAFGATTAVVRRTPETSDLVDAAGTMADLPKFLPQADVIVLACSLNNDTRDFADEAFFGAIKEGALLVNIARGALIVDSALIKALDEDRLATAVLDVFRQEPLPADDPLWSHPNIRLTPHTSFSGDGVNDRWQQLFFDNLTRLANGEALQGLVKPSDIT
ncbi:MAG: D-2-hydroxyacid dehydrogenase [Rhodospirillaceae bacterium]|jgi:phosphoglycerate dehydrogenase-like enzyme|nr:D-2-hydroxyacid dehydrogenase [Rhodospirillaceae bacterium]MBT4689442.1 D-2-hydroxyacid dehydrogenase [Rhodospirillaceae bacterium]MBT5079162.1 D-2-hydroxyacid dehydrogenase [Rhodospirillaceae bacterium]MBT5527472.1 D-2-hydroxyacid dehydrogenase [Rhodospirillaceae bacterium]MBT5878699.1 D-2-hydroxyacid dehydrogenase [Rhodospirillaceae bacterium]